MKILDKTADGLKRFYSVWVSKKELDAATDKKLAETAKKIRMDGFRPGKVPVDIVRRMYGDSVALQAKDILIDDLSRKIIKDDKLSISFNYSSDIVKEDEEGLEFLLKFELIPTFELQDVSTIEVHKHVADVSDEAVDKLLDSLKKEHINWIDAPEGHEVADGNRVIIDMVMLSDGIKNIQKEMRDLRMVIGDKTIISDFWKPLIGAKLNDVKTFSVVYPEDFGEPSLAGKTLEYQSTIKSISISTEFNLDDQFANYLGYKDFAGLREIFKTRTLSKYEYMSKDIMRRDLMDKLSDQYTFDVPQNVLDVEMKEVVRQIREEAVKFGKEFTPYIEEECRLIATKRVRLGFVISEIAKKEKIFVTNNEVNRTIRNIASMYPTSEKAMMKACNNISTRQAVLGPILEDKVVDFLLGKIKIVDEPCTIEELVAWDEEPFDFFKDGYQPETKTIASGTDKNASDAEGTANTDDTSSAADAVNAADTVDANSTETPSENTKSDETKAG